MNKDTKKKFQKMIAVIREDVRKEFGLPDDYEYPKAMLTSQQAANGTATVNCGKEVGKSFQIGKRVLHDPRFEKFMDEERVVVARIEAIQLYVNQRYQVRLIFAEKGVEG